MTPQRNRAFTLIELLVVILIMAIVAAVMVPAFAGFLDKTRFDAEIRRIQDYFALAREKAVKGDTTVTLHFEHSVKQFTITVDPVPPARDMPTALLTGAGSDLGATSDVQPYRVADDYRVERFSVTGANGPTALSQSDVRFNGDGTSNGAALEILSKQGYTASMTLSPMNGRLTLDMPTEPGR